MVPTLRGWVLALFTGAAALLGQVPDSLAVGIPAMQVHGEREGLPHPTLHALAMDGAGRIWVGTQDGAAIFNGRSWTTVAFPPECRSRFIRALALTPDGSAWFGTQDDGLWQRLGDRWIHHDGPQGLPARRINHLQWVPEGGSYTLWVATSTLGVARLNQGQWRVWGPREGLRDPWVWRIRPERGRVWILGLGGLAALVGDRVDPAPLGVPWTAPCNEILDLRQPDGSGEVLLSCWDKGLVRWDGKQFREQGPGQGFPSRNPVVLTQTADADGTRVLWAGTYDRGLAWKRGAGPWMTLEPDRGFPSTGVYDLLPDPRKKPALWIALRQGGLGSLDPGGWILIDTRQGRPLNRILSMARAGRGPGEQAWFGTEQGVMHWGGSGWVHEDASTGFPATLVNSLLETRAFGEPRLLAGTLKGLVAKGPKGWAPLAGSPFPGAQAMSMLEREEQGAPALWVGFEGGLARYHRGAWTRFTSQDGLPQDWIYALAAALDRDGQQSLWVGTRGGGVVRYRQHAWVHYGVERGLPNPSVYGLLIEPLPGGRQRLWAATYGGGLAWIDPDDPDARWQALTTATTPALPSDATLRLERDGTGRIYATTTRGVVRLEGPPGTDPGPAWSLITFTEGDGLPSRLCNQGASLMDPEGRLWVGTAAGLAVLDPRLATTAPAPGLPVLEQVLVRGQAIPSAGPITLSHGQSPLAFEFSLPTFHRPEDLRYQTQILGLEESPGPWSPDAKRELAGLGAGSYVLRVRARDHLGRLTEPLDIPFTLRPAPWRTPWAYAVYLLAAAGLLAGAHRLRVGLLKARNRALQGRIREATSDITRQKEALEEANAHLKFLDDTKSRMLGIVAHDLRNPLSAILMNSEFLSDTDITVSETNEVAGKIRQCALFMHELLRRFLDLEAIERGKLEYNIQSVDPIAIIESVLESQSTKARSKGLELVLEVPPDLPLLLADSVYLQEVLENLLSNAIKFSPKGPPARRITLSAGPGWLEIRDEGPGFTQEDMAKAFGQFVRLTARPTAGESSTGLGLAIVKALVEGMGGRITLDSAPGRGAAFRVTLKLPEGVATPSA